MSQPNIIWLTIESTRFDHTMLGGYKRNTTPRINEVASRNEAVQFSKAFSHAIWTLPSSASILTGTYPTHHRTGFGNTRLPDSLPTAAELLGEVGYSTACLPTAPYLSEEYGTVRGFDRVERLSVSNLKRPRLWSTALKYISRIRKHGGGLTTDTRMHSREFMMNDVLRQWINQFQNSGDPFFIYAHYGGPHHPYTPPLGFINQFLDDCSFSAMEARDLAVDITEHLDEVIANGCDLTEDEIEALIALYDAEIAHTDYCLGRLIDYIDQYIDKETLIVITADHGELFGEHDLLSHKLVLDDALVRVPLVLYGSGVTDIMHQNENFVQHADVTRFILDLAGADTTTVQGIDLQTESRDFVVVQRGESSARKNIDHFLDINPEFNQSEFELSPLSAIRTDIWKYVSGDDYSALYELPDEFTDTSEHWPEVTARLNDKLTKWFETKGQPFTQQNYEAEPKGDTKQRLRDLGYL